MEKILLIEPDKKLCSYLNEELSEEGFQVKTAQKGSEIINSVEEINPDLILLDVSLDDIRGEEVCLHLRRDYPDIPLILLVAESEADKIIEKFQCGANDFVTKPINTRLLILRIKIRLSEQNPLNQTLQVGNLSLDTRTHEVKRGDKNIELTPREFELLKFLMKNENRVLSREIILNRIWSYPQDVESRVVDVYIGYLREKIDKDFDKKLIRTVRGFGYKISKT